MVQQHLLERRKFQLIRRIRICVILEPPSIWIKKNSFPTILQKVLNFSRWKRKSSMFHPSEDIDKVIAVADPDEQDFLLVIRETMARVSEINRLLWEDVDLENRVSSYTPVKRRAGI
jgi:integrase